MRATALQSSVMRGLDPRIHVDGRIKSGHDDDFDGTRKGLHDFLAPCNDMGT